MTIEYGFARCWLRKYLKNMSALFVCISWYMLTKASSHYAICKETFIVNLLKKFYLLFSQFLKYAFYITCAYHCSHLTRGTQRLLSVRRSKYCLEFSVAWGRLEFLDNDVPFMYNFRSLSNKFTTIFWSLIFHISLPRLGYFS